MKKIYLTAFAVMMLFSLEAKIAVQSSGCTPGYWTSDVTGANGAKAYGAAHKRPYLILCGKNDGSCQLCNQSSIVYGSAEFLAWSVENDMPLAYADSTAVPTTNAQSYRTRYYGTIPVYPRLICFDGHGGDKYLWTFILGLGQESSHGWIQKPFDCECVLGCIRSEFQKGDETYSTARKVTVTETLQKVGLYEDWGKNGLNAAYWYTDYLTKWWSNDVDWYSFANIDISAGKGVAIGVTDLKEDPQGAATARIRVYDSATAAAAGEPWVADCALADLVSEPLIIEPNTGAERTYVKVYRDDVTKTIPTSKVNGTFVLDAFEHEYNLTFQAVESRKTAFFFAKQTIDFKEGERGTITLYRDNADNDAVATVEFVSCVPGAGQKQAIKGTHYNVKEQQFVFPAGSFVANVEALELPANDIWELDRVLKVQLRADSPASEEGYASATVVIHEYDKDDPPSGIEEIVVDGASLGRSLGGTDGEDVFVLSNAVAGLRYKASLAVLFTNGIDSASLEIYREGADKPFRTLKGECGYLHDIYFALTEEMTNLILKVRADGWKSGEGSLLRYNVAVVSEAMPVLSFAGEETVRRKTVAVDYTNQFKVCRTWEGGNVLGHVTNTFNWCTVEETAEAEDYEAVPGAKAAFEGNEATVGVLVKGAARWRPERSFKVRLLPPDFDRDEYYVLGEVSEVTLVLSEVPSGNGGDGTRANPARVAFVPGEGAWLDQERNVSHTTREDWIEIGGIVSTDPKTGDLNYFRLGCRSTVRPSDTEVWVEVCTNFVPIAGSRYSLSELNAFETRTDHITESGWPVVSFPGLKDGKVQLHIVRDADADVWAQYQLGLSPWTRPTVSLVREGLTFDPKTGHCLVDDTNETFAVTVRATGYTVSFPMCLAFAAYTAPGDTATAVDYEAVTNVTWVTLDPEKGAVQDETLSVRLVPDLVNRHTGNRTFTFGVALVDKFAGDAYVTNALSGFTVELKDLDRERDAFDPGDDVASGAVTKAISVTPIDQERRLNGSDVSDWFAFTGIRAGSSYRFSLAGFDEESDLVNVTASNVFVVVEMPGAAPVTNSFANLTALVGTFDAVANGTARVQVWRKASADRVVSVRYTLEASEWEYPVVAFETAEVVTNDACGTLRFKLVRSGNVSDAIMVSVKTACSGSERAVEGVDFTGTSDPSLTFASDQTNDWFEVMIPPGEDGIWRGNGRDFHVEVAAAKGQAVKFGTDRVHVVINSRVSEYEAGDSKDESFDNPGVSEDARPKEETPDAWRTLHGADTADYFVFHTEPGETYRVFAGGLTNLANCAAKDLQLEISYPDAAGPKTERMTWQALLNRPGSYWDTPVLSAAGDVCIRVSRSFDGTKFVSCGYLLKVFTWPWPRMSFVADDPVGGVAEIEADRNAKPAEVPFTVVREDNTELQNTVHVWAEGDPVFAAFDERIVFAPGQVETNLAVCLTCATNMWTGNYAFTIKLGVERDESVEKITTGDCTNLVVHVLNPEAYPQYDAADLAGDATSNAPGVPSRDRFSATWGSMGKAHLNGRKGFNGAQGDDLCDWYRFDGVEANATYYFQVQNLRAENAGGLTMKAEFYKDGNLGTPAVTKTLADLARGDVSVTTTQAKPIYVKVWRSAAAHALPVYVEYELQYRKMAPRNVSFTEDAKTVSSLASSFSVKIVCDVTGVIDSSDVTVLLCPTNDWKGPHSAADDRYDPTVQKHVWKIGDEGGTWEATVSLPGRSTAWRGDETFRLVLVPDEDTAFGDYPEMVVTIRDDATPDYGTVRIVEPVSTRGLHEGDVLRVPLRREGGLCGDVSLLWTWRSAGKTLEEKHSIGVFKERGDRTAEVALTVPTVPGFQPGQQMTLSLAVDEGTKARIAGTTELTLTDVQDADFGETVSEYAVDGSSGEIDRTKVAFRASGTSWYVSSDASKALVTGLGDEVVLSTSVKGPGKLRFKVSLADAVNCDLVGHVGASPKRLAVGDAELDIPAGTRLVRVVFTRRTGSLPTSSARITDVTFVPDTGKFNAIGNFSGPANVDGKPAAAAMTVSQIGRVSGKFTGPDGNWTFSSTSGFADVDVLEVTARHGAESVQLTLTLDRTTGRVLAAPKGERPAADIRAELVRAPWDDMPMAAAPSALLASTVGYYTVTLEGECCGDDTYGSGYLMVTVSGNGQVRAVGVLADGQAVSLGGTLMSDGTSGEPCVWLYASPSVYRKGWFAMLLTFRECGKPGVRAVFSGLPDPLFPASLPTWEREGASGFSRDVPADGGWYSRTEDLKAYYEGGLGVTAHGVSSLTYAGQTYAPTDWATHTAPVRLEFTTPTSVAVREMTDTSLLSMTLNRATGLFTGSLKAEYEVNQETGRTISKSVPYRGVLTPVRLVTEGTAEGRGFFLMEEKSYDLTIER